MSLWNVVVCGGLAKESNQHPHKNPRIRFISKQVYIRSNNDPCQVSAKYSTPYTTGAHASQAASSTPSKPPPHSTVLHSSCWYLSRPSCRSARAFTRMFRVLVLAMVGMVSVAAWDYTEYGPYTGTSKIYGHTMPSSTGCSGWDCGIKVTVTKPDAYSGGEYVSDRQAPFPVIFMFNAFQSYASYYRHYVEHLVSFGYVIVQYDTKKMCILTDKTEAAYFPHLLEWLKEQNAENGGFLSGLIDFDQVGVAGHSRGGKLAALHTARMDDVKAAYLIDPVDNDGHFAKESEDYPSAAKALVGKNKRIGVVGSGITGRCNPDGANYKKFWNALDHGSWLTVIQSAGHCQYISAPPLFEWAMGVLCGHGGNSCEEVITVTRPGMVAWFEKTFRGLPAEAENSLTPQNGGFLDAFFDWVEHMEEKQVLDFNVKGQKKPFPEDRYFPHT